MTFYFYYFDLSRRRMRQIIDLRSRDWEKHFQKTKGAKEFKLSAYYNFITEKMLIITNYTLISEIFFGCKETRPVWFGRIKESSINVRRTIFTGHLRIKHMAKALEFGHWGDWIPEIKLRYEEKGEFWK